MKLAFFDDRAFTVRGAQTTMLTVANAARSAGHDVVVISTGPGPLRERTEALGLSWVAHPLPGALDTYGGAMRTVGAREKVAAAAAIVPYGIATTRLLRRLEVDAVYLSAMRPSLYSWPIGFTRISSLLYVQGAEDLGIMSKISGLVPDRVAVVSSASMAAIGMQGSCPSWIAVVPAGIKTAPTAWARPRRTSSATIVSVGEISDDKGQELLIRACAIAASPQRPIHLRLVGDADSPMARCILDRVQPLISGDLRLTVEGVLSGAEAIYRDADLQVLTSRVEGTPKVLAEGLSTGLRCLAFAVGGVAEYVGGRPGAIVIEPTDDPGELAAELVRALDSAAPDEAIIASSVAGLDEASMAAEILELLTAPRCHAQTNPGSRRVRIRRCFSRNG